MNATATPVHSPTAADVMSRDLVVVPRQMPVRQAARLLHQARASAAPVVDEHGRCVGMLTPADVFRWVEAGCPEAVVGPVHTCPYQVRGRLLNGDEAVICVLAHGGCPFQAVHPTTGGRQTDVCVRKASDPPGIGQVPRYMTPDVPTDSPNDHLQDIVQQITDTRTADLIVLDEFDRPIGIVSATDALRC